MKRYILILLSISLCGCHIYYSFTSKLGGNKSGIAETSIPLDSTYRFYVRQLYKSEKSGERRLKTNFTKGAAENDTLIEVEFLFISEPHQNIIYISNVPDKYQRYYEDNYLGDQFANVYDFRVFLFGRMNSKMQFKFLSKDKRYDDTWDIEYSHDHSAVTLVNLPVKEALEEPVRFKYVPDYKIVFRDYKNFKDTAYLAGDKIFFNSSGKKYELYFHFDRLLNGSSNNVYFKDRRIIYSPDALYNNR